MAVPIKIAVNINFVKPDCIGRVSKAAEDLGYGMVWVGEHMAMPTEEWWLDYPHYVAALRDGKDTTQAKANAAPPTMHFCDPMVVLTAAAAATSRILVGTGIYQLSMRNPVVAARAITALDNISGGRLDLGVGMGWSEREYHNVEIQWAKRGKRFEECIQALRVLFKDEAPEFHGELIDFGPIGFWPKPVQDPVPIRLGGSGPKGVRRAALMGNGWFGPSADIPTIMQIREEAGLADEPYDCIAMTRGKPNAEELVQLASEGGQYASVNIINQPMGLEAIDVLEGYAREIGLEA